MLNSSFSWNFSLTFRCFFTFKSDQVSLSKTFNAVFTLNLDFIISFDRFIGFITSFYVYFSSSLHIAFIFRRYLGFNILDSFGVVLVCCPFDLSSEIIFSDFGRIDFAFFGLQQKDMLCYL